VYQKEDRIYFTYQDSGKSSVDKTKTQINSEVEIIKILANQIQAQIVFNDDYSGVSFDFKAL
jgi:hypothetical protein